MTDAFKCFVSSTPDLSLKNPFGLRDGKVIVIGDLSIDERGLACKCVCPACKKDFEARMGEKRVWHFAHSKNADCDIDDVIKIGIYMFVAETFLACDSVSMPPCYLQVDPALKDSFEKEFLHNPNCNPNCTKIFLQENFEKYIKLSSAVLSETDTDSNPCFIPLRVSVDDVPDEFRQRSNDGTYEAFVNFAGFAFPQLQSIKVPSEYTSDLGVPTSLIIRGFNLRATRVVLSFDRPVCTPKSLLAQLNQTIESTPQSDDEIPSLEIRIDETLFSGCTLTSEKLKEQIFQPCNMRWLSAPASLYNKCVSYMKLVYEREHLEWLCRYYKKQLTELQKQPTICYVDTCTGEVIEQP